MTRVAPDVATILLTHDDSPPVYVISACIHGKFSAGLGGEHTQIGTMEVLPSGKVTITFYLWCFSRDFSDFTVVTYWLFWALIRREGTIA